MKAWQFTGTDRPLVLAEVDEPVADVGEVVIRVDAAGLCHTDVSVLRDPSQLQLMAHLPMTIGHEIAGTVIELGDGVTDFVIGDRVGVRPSAESLPGFGRSGGFTAKHVAPASELVSIPDGLDIALGAIGTDAGMTAYHAMVQRGCAREGMKVGIIGFGGLGQIGSRIAVMLGASVHIAEPKREVWHLASQMGATSIVADASEWGAASFDLIVDYAGYNTTAAALAAVKYDGAVVQVGFGSSEISFPTGLLIYNRRLIGSMGGTKQDMAAVYDLMAKGKLNPTYSTLTFDEIPDGLARLERGEVSGRLVALMNDQKT